ncbi:MAG: hypothetical protein D6731_15640 [Planctomycetota bacterium]|nr:MAG: hypothetical protein D6731_15640 [Planctomycetota bacterium]
MKTFTCDVEPDPKRREEPVLVSKVYMAGNWSFHAYKRSHDGRYNIVHRADGFDVFKGKTRVRYKYTFHGAERGFYWSPDNRRIVYFGTGEPGVPDGGRCVVLLDMARVTEGPEGQKPPHEVLYAPPQGHVPFGLEWSPRGEAVYVLEKYREEHVLYSRLLRVTLQGHVSQVVRMGGIIDFFMPPVSRFENGSGPDDRPYWIVFGHPTGLYLTDPKGKSVRHISKLPAVGLHNIEWHPRKNQFTLFFRRATVGPTGERFRGVYLVHLDRIGRAKPEKESILEHLYDDVDVHTLWYSPYGKYVCFASEDAIYYRKVGESGEMSKIVPVLDDIELEVKGVSWHPNERWLAFTAGNHLFVKDVDTEDEPRLIASFGSDTTHFAAEPVWTGDRVYLTVFEDLTRRKRRRPSKKPVFGKPEEVKKEVEKARRGGRG